MYKVTLELNYYNFHFTNKTITTTNLKGVFVK